MNLLQTNERLSQSLVDGQLNEKFVDFVQPRNWRSLKQTKNTLEILLVLTYEVLRMRFWIVVFISLYADLRELAREVFHKLYVVSLRIYFCLAFQHEYKLILLNTKYFCDILAEMTNWLVIGETYRFNQGVGLIKPTLHLNHDRFEARHSSSQVIFDN